MFASLTWSIQTKNAVDAAVEGSGGADGRPPAKPLGAIARSAALKVFVAIVLLRLLTAVTLGDQNCDLLTHVAAAPGNIALRRRKNGPAASEKDDFADYCGSYARYSSLGQREEGIGDQQRKCREKAQTNGHRISPELEFSDEAVSGTKLRRAGLDAMLAAAEQGRLRVLYLFSLSRLARESIITMPVLKKLVHIYGVRVICVADGIDTAQNGWELIATIYAVIHEQYIKDLSENVFRGQEGAILSGYALADHCYGYCLKPIPGSEAQRRGKQPKPRKMYAIDPVTAPWVKRIFYWYVVERRSPRWIARELNRLGAPKDRRAKSKHWHHQLVASILENEKYVGLWRWGEQRNKRDPSTGTVTKEQRPEEETAKWIRHFPQLRLISDEVWNAAQARLEHNRQLHEQRRKEHGKLNGSRTGNAASNPQHLLSRLVRCSHCGSFLRVCGGDGKYLGCPGWARGTCPCKTQLRRDRAERMVLQEIGERVLSNPAWRDAVLAATLANWNRLNSESPNQRDAIESAIADLDRRIEKLMDQLEEVEESAAAHIKRRIAQREVKRRGLEAELRELPAISDHPMAKPDGPWADQRLGCLAGLLAKGGPAAAHALRELVGGEISVTEIQRPGRKRHYLRAQFSIRVASLVRVANAYPEPTRFNPQTEECTAEQITIDFIDADPADALAEEAKRLYDQSLMCKEIAQQMGIWPSQVTKLLKHWCQLHGQALPDARVRRASLPRKTMEVHQYERVADDAVALMQRGFSDAKIGKKLGCSAFVAGKAIKHWHRLQNLPTPTTRQRREARARLAKKLRDEGQTMKAIALELECSEPTLCRLLDLAYRLEGRERPDGRSQRKSSSKKKPPLDPPADSDSSAA